MNLGLQGKVALVTGGSHGIGLATAQALAGEGCKVAICARDDTRLRLAAAAIPGGALWTQADAQKSEDIERVVAHVALTYGRLDILVNNVGGGGRWGSAVVEEVPERVWDDVYAKNAGAAARFTRLAIPYMSRAAWGRVVTVSSIHGVEAGGRPWFAMAKAAEVALMGSLARLPYLVRAGITFNAVAPGGVMIPDTGWAQEQVERPMEFHDLMMSSAHPAGRLGTPEEVAAVIAFLCSDGARFVNGATVVVDGGESRRF